jgi:iron complex outermembrane receptor protein
MKTTLFDNLRLNIAFFDYDYKNIQAFQVNGTSTVLTNAANARVNGIDADFATEFGGGFSLTGGTTWLLENRYGSFPIATITYVTPPPGAPVVPGFTQGYGNYVFGKCAADYNPATKTYSNGASAAVCSASGNRIVNSPRFTPDLSLKYVTELAGGTFKGVLTWQYNSGYNFSVDNRVKEPPYSLFNVRLNWESPDEIYNFTLWSRNLGDEKYYSSINPNTGGDAYFAAPGRTFGASVEGKF